MAVAQMFTIVEVANEIRVLVPQISTRIGNWKNNNNRNVKIFSTEHFRFLFKFYEKLIIPDKFCIRWYLVVCKFHRKR